MCRSTFLVYFVFLPSNSMIICTVMIIVKTDINPLTCVTSTAKLDATQHRYNFTIEYRSCKQKVDAGGLSRRYILNGEVKAIYQAVIIPASVLNSSSGTAAAHMKHNEEVVESEPVAKINWTKLAMLLYHLISGFPQWVRTACAE